MKLNSELLLAAYCQGLFPMAHEDGELYWHDPDPRAILPLGRFHASRSLLRVIRAQKYEIRFDSSFEEVIRGCAAAHPGREETWINEEIITAFMDLHRRGFAHSVESWRGDELCGGLYGVAIRGLFAGESMFSRQRDASKAALFYLVRSLLQDGFILLDVQYMTEHLRGMGAIEISSQSYRARLSQALTLPVRFSGRANPQDQ